MCARACVCLERKSLTRGGLWAYDGVLGPLQIENNPKRVNFRKRKDKYGHF